MTKTEFMDTVVRHLRKLRPIMHRKLLKDAYTHEASIESIESYMDQPMVDAVLTVVVNHLANQMNTHYGFHAREWGKADGTQPPAQVRRVWKYKVNEHGPTTMQLGAEIVRVGTQRSVDPNAVFVWVIVDPRAETEPRKLRLCGTGGYVAPRSRYIGSASMLHCGEEWHVFEDV